MRALIYIPVMHYPAEVGEGIAQRELGNSRGEYVRALDAYWDGLDGYLSQRSVDRIFQDSCFFPFLEEDMHRRMSSETRNSKAICDLVRRGAKLMRTESFLLVAGHALGSVVAREDFVKSGLYGAFIERRDRRVARSIGRGLRDGETGVLFMGGAHKVDEVLRTQYPSIAVERYEDGYAAVDTVFEKGRRSSGA